MSPSPLPIDAALPELLTALKQHGAVVLIAPPGAGKTTRVPPAILDAGLAGSGKILVLQPRRVAARAAARRIAEERGVTLGEQVGYRVRFDVCAGPNTRIELLTEGLLTRRLQTDPFLEDTGCVILDEFHERSLNVDLALALLREVRRDARPDLRLVVMSATLEPGPIATYLGCPVVRSDGRTFPVTVHYDERPSTAPTPARAAAAARAALDATPDGHVLVFLPGVREIERTARALNDLVGVAVLPLHGRLPAEAQDHALAPSAQRKIVLATNIAETSVTLAGVRAVVDTGLARSPQFDTAIGLTRLELGRISLASAEQRAGRAGRTGPGWCRRLWTRGEHRGMQPQRPAEIRRVELARVALELVAWGTDPAAFEWFETPPEAALDHAMALLVRIGAIHDRAITPLGRRLLALPVPPRLARVVIAGADAGHLRDAATVAALATERDIFRRPPAHSGGSDLMLRLEALRGVRGAEALDRRAAAQVRRVSSQLIRLAGGRAGRPADEETLARLLLTAFPERVARRRAPRSDRFHLASGAGAVLHPDSGVRDAMFILAVSLRGARRGERAEHRIHIATAIDPSWLPANTTIETRFDAGRGLVVQERVRRFMALVLGRKPAGEDADPEAATAALIQAVARDPRRALQWDAPVEAFLLRLRWLAKAQPELSLPTFPELDGEHPDAPLWAALCMGKRSFAQLRRAPLLPLLQGFAGHHATSTLSRLAPTSLALPDGSTRRLTYREDGPPVLAARIQQLFGLTETPTVAGGRIKVLLHLLAPNQRPAQITDDLAGFWRVSYALVRKDLRGRYPKHPWPEDPANAEPPKRRPRRR